MARKPKRIKVPPGSELTKLLADAGDAPVVLETNGELYRLDRMEKQPEDIWAGYDPGRVRAAIDRYEGIWAERDPDPIIERIHRARDEGSR